MSRRLSWSRLASILVDSGDRPACFLLPSVGFCAVSTTSYMPYHFLLSSTFLIALYFLHRPLLHSVDFSAVVAVSSRVVGLVFTGTLTLLCSAAKRPFVCMPSAACRYAPLAVPFHRRRFRIFYSSRLLQGTQSTRFIDAVFRILHVVC